MISSPRFLCRCQPIARVEMLGAQIIRFDFSFEQKIPAFVLSDIQIWLKSKNTQDKWIKLELTEYQYLDSSRISVWIKPDIHSITTKLLSFDPIRFTQERLNLEIKIQFSQQINPRTLPCRILPVYCLGVEEFRQHSFCDFSYSVYFPHQSNNKHPLIVCLHGAGEGGKNQSNLLADKMAITFWNESTQELFDYPYILAPQCPSFWLKNFVLNDRTYYGERDYTDDLLKLVIQFIARHPNIDRQRIYIVGGSMGGYQGLRLFSAKPDLFAAALIACPAQVPTKMQLNALINKPIWFLHCNSDQVVPVENTQKIIRYLISQGDSPVQVTYFDEIVVENRFVNPHCVFLYLYENQVKIGKTSIFEWLTQQRRWDDE
ncbi:prolyl oligopeptidase family serine peptidase [Rodentibacter sp. Ppn85]|uniref:carboxylesterase family protein n=1 Tax=Rodentibacter sp. Ppn85 TaxID=1908525 RepID=UPI0009871811|nr:prolyl oligopeptidase family serine peptidase [Rodentibacter sp. Ppn85]OOF62472.1 glucan-binding protein [Rodentibacter sp. Ppn85]